MERKAYHKVLCTDMMGAEYVYGTLATARNHARSRSRSNVQAMVLDAFGNCVVAYRNGNRVTEGVCA